MRADLPVVCTGRDTHQVVTITRVYDGVDGKQHMSRMLEAWAPPGTTRDDGTVTTTYEFQCARCGRNVRLAAEKWWQAVKFLRSVGVSRLDISILPF